MPPLPEPPIQPPAQPTLEERIIALEARCVEMEAEIARLRSILHRQDIDFLTVETKTS